MFAAFGSPFSPPNEKLGQRLPKGIQHPGDIGGMEGRFSDGPGRGVLDAHCQQRQQTQRKITKGITAWGSEEEVDDGKNGKQRRFDQQKKRGAKGARRKGKPKMPRNDSQDETGMAKRCGVPMTNDLARNRPRAQRCFRSCER